STTPYLLTNCGSVLGSTTPHRLPATLLISHDAFAPPFPFHDLEYHNTVISPTATTARDIPPFENAKLAVDGASVTSGYPKVPKGIRAHSAIKCGRYLPLGSGSRRAKEFLVHVEFLLRDFHKNRSMFTPRVRPRT